MVGLIAAPSTTIYFVFVVALEIDSYWWIVGRLIGCVGTILVYSQLLFLCGIGASFLFLAIIIECYQREHRFYKQNTLIKLRYRSFEKIRALKMSQHSNDNNNISSNNNEDRKRTVEEAAADLYGLCDDVLGTAAAAAAALTRPLLPQPIKPSKIAKTSSAGSSATAVASTTSTTTTPPPLPGASATLLTSNNNTDKAYKGLRHFSMMVCKKVEEKGTTTYNEVADELVHAVIEERRREQPSDASTRFDEKNIRRRVYDALNVLMAMDIIYKDKKEISWKGLPTTASQDLEMLHRELSFRQSEVNRKRDALQELLMQQVCFRNLVDHNANRQGTTMDVTKDNKIPLPFIVVNTSSSAVIQCNMSRDLTDVMFDFSMPFEINDDNTILKRLGLYVD